MKYPIILLLGFSLLSMTAPGQCDNSLVGKWKVAAILYGGAYLNLKTDSVHFSAPMANFFSSDSSKQVFITEQKKFYEIMEFHFINDSNFNLRMIDDYIENIKYCFKRNENRISITTKDHSGKNNTTDQLATLKNGLLYYTITPIGLKEFALEVMLEKIAAH